MTSEIEEKIYDLVTKNENFEFAFDIHSRFESIKERMIQEFWDLLIISFKKKFPNYKFSNEENNDFNFEIFISSIKNTSFYINFEEETYQYGFGILHNGTKKNIKEIEEKFINVLNEYSYEPENKTSWFYENNEEEFESSFGLKKILPKNRTLLIEKYIKDFEKMIESVQVTILKK